MNLYHVHDVIANQTSDFSSFDEAYNSYGFTAEPPDETYILSFDGDGEYFAYSVTYGQAGNAWFTDSAEDSPTHHDFGSQSLMAARVKHIDNLAHGIM